MLIALLALPFTVSQNSWYEWSNASWLLELQTAHVHAFGTPSYFTDAAGMLFYPQQLFYAGPLVSVLAYPAVVLGAWPVFAAVTALTFPAMSAGVSWTARNLGVPGVLPCCRVSPSPPPRTLSPTFTVGVVDTNLVASPLIRITGTASRAATTNALFVALRVDRSPWQATVTSVCGGCLALGSGVPSALILGRWASVLGVAAVLSLLLVAGIDRWRHRGRRPMRGPPDDQASGRRM